VQEFKGTTREGKGETTEAGATRAIARLPGLDIEIMHWHAHDNEQISIGLKATPSFEAFGRALEAANPFAFWARAAQLAWLPWFETARVLALPWATKMPSLLGHEDTSRSAEGRNSPD
jgi:hypothetical protein